MVEYSLYPICDTNILIDLKLGDIFQQFLKSNIKVNVADKVKDEMDNKFSKSQKYNFLLDVFQEENIQIIEESIFSEEQKRVMMANLVSYKIQNFIGKKARGKDVGEFASALYAVNLGIKKLYTNDKNFIRDYGKELIFRNLEMVDLNCTLAEFLKDAKRIRVNSKIEIENAKMKSALKEEFVKKVKEEDEKQTIDRLLDKLVEKYSQNN